MNDIFNINRFGKLLVKDLRMMCNKMWIAPVILVSVYVLSWVINAISNWSVTQIPPIDDLPFAVMIIFILLSPSMIYNDVNGKYTGLEFALLPASALEKFLSMLFVTVLALPLSLIVVHVALNALSLLVAYIAGAKIAGTGLYYLYNIGGITIWECLFRTAIFISAYFLGNLCFKNHKFIKTTVLIIALFVTVLIVGTWIVASKLGLAVTVFFNSFVEDPEALGRNWMIFRDIMDWVMFAILPISLYVISFFKIKKLQYK